MVLRVLGRRHRLRQRDQWTREQLQAYQLRALRQLREHAYAHSPFYRRFHAGRIDRPLREVPVLTKAMVMEHLDELVTDPAVRLAEVEAHLAALDAERVSPGAARRAPGSHAPAEALEFLLEV